MRAPDRLHGWCRSVLPLAIVALFLVSSDPARAAGKVGDEGFIQAVVSGRKDAREAYERARQVERVNAAEESRRREREAADRRTDRDATSSSGRPRPVRDEIPEAPFPWYLVAIGGVTVGGVMLLRAVRRR